MGGRSSTQQPPNIGFVELASIVVITLKRFLRAFGTGAPQSLGVRRECPFCNFSSSRKMRADTATKSTSIISEYPVSIAIVTTPFDCWLIRFP
jgi:hypothetical protein